MDASEQPERYMGGVYVSESLKILLTVALFIAAIRVLRVELVPTMIGYAATFFVYWVVLKTGFPGAADVPATERTDD